MKKLLIGTVTFLSLTTATPSFAQSFRQLPPIDTFSMFRVRGIERLKDQGYRRPATNILDRSLADFMTGRLSFGSLRR